MTITTNSTITELIAKLNSAVKQFTDIRVTDSFSFKKGYTYTHLHDDIKAAITPILEPLGLEYYIWSIRPVDTYAGEDRELLMLDADIKLDKGQKYHSRRGRIMSLEFKPVQALDYTLTDGTKTFSPDDAIETVLIGSQLPKLCKNIDEQIAYIAKLEEDLKAAKDHLAKYRTQRATLKSELEFARKNQAARVAQAQLAPQEIAADIDEAPLRSPSSELGPIRSSEEYKQMTPYLATGYAEGFEEPERAEQVLAAWQYLHDTGLAYQLQGGFGRTATNLIGQGLIEA